MPKWIKDVPQWICWREHNGTKRPCDKWGEWCGSNSRECYMTYDDADTYSQLRGLEGPAWCFTPEDEYIGIDIDDCYDPISRWFHEWAWPIIDRLDELQTYYERSPSDTGIKAWIGARMPECWATKKQIDGGGMIEIFGKSHQFFTFTGNKWPCQFEQVTDGQEFLQWLLETYGFHKPERGVPVSTAFRGRESVTYTGLMERMISYADSVGSPGPGERNNTLFRLAGHLNAFTEDGVGPSADQVLEVVRGVNARLAEPLADEEVQKCVRSGIENGTPREKKEGRQADPAERPKLLTKEELSQIVNDESTDKAKSETRHRLHQRLYAFPALMRLDTSQEWLIDGVLVAKEPCIIAGPSKSMKTSVTIDLAISLAMGGNFLQNPEWPIATPRRVLLMSGESGLATLQETSRRIFEASGGGEEYDRIGENLLVSPDIPKYGVVGDQVAIEDVIAKHGTDVLIVDPAYLAVPIGDSASNMFRVGEIIAPMAQMCESKGCMMILLHHARKNRANDKKPMELADISWSGFDAFARQWLLVSRRSPYSPGSGSHELWLSWGGSAGHSGLRGLTIDEGVDVHNRTWRVMCYTEEDANGDGIDLGEDGQRSPELQARIDKREAEKLDAERTRIIDHLIAAESSGVPWQGATKIASKKGAKLRKSKALRLLKDMVNDGDIIRRDVVVRGKKATEYRLPSDEQIDGEEPQPSADLSVPD